jgi:hypothetical protein
MKIETKYNYEKIWTLTEEKDLLKIIEEEVGDADAKATLLYIQEVIQSGRELGVGSCKFRKKK